MPDPEIPSPNGTPSSPIKPDDKPAGPPLEAPPTAPAPDEDGDGRPYGQG